MTDEKEIALPSAEEIVELKASKDDLIALVMRAQTMWFETFADDGAQLDDIKALSRLNKDKLRQLYADTMTEFDEIMNSPILKDYARSLKEVVVDATDGDGKFNWKRVVGVLLVIAATTAAIFLL